MERPVQGDPLHTRSLSYSAYATEGGGVRVHSDIIDLRKSGFIPMGGDFQAAGIIHKMEIAFELDRKREIVKLEVDQPVVAIEPSEASDHECCRDPAPALQALVGDVVDANFAKRVSQVAGGPRGCSHLVTLFQLMASGVPPALDREAEERARDGVERRPGERIANRSLFVDGFDAGDRIQLWVRSSDVDTLPLERVQGSFDRLDRQQEIRVLAEVASSGFTLQHLTAEQRERGAHDFGSTAWEPLADDVSDLTGIPMMAGFARELFARFGARPERRLLLDALLNLAPGFIQVVAALSDRVMVASSGAAASGGASDSGGMMSLGGREGSCYMWRSESPLLQIRKGNLGR